MTHTIMSVPEYTKNGYGKECIIASNHFLIQQVRIPLREKANVKKIVQIGLNIGQWNGRPRVLQIKYPRNLNKISGYISKSNIHKLSKKISDVTLNNVLQYLSSK